MKTIVQTAIDSGMFNTLVSAIKEANLAETLNGSDYFTVFAPTDEAFAKLPEGKIDDLMKDKETLVKILTYHVIPGKMMAKDIVEKESLKTAQGEDVRINSENGVMINDAKVTEADIECSNGVIHIIDSVLMPK
jgi:uncharacterized surface protein with fasciclin (FAS1) repeats